MAGKILRYSPDGAALITNKFQTIWNTTYKMDNPKAFVRDNYAVIADIDGTKMEIFGKNQMDLLRQFWMGWMIHGLISMQLTEA